ncbi:MAG TPA: pilus assembly protein TadG-related protein [Oculatellaceae cyanobacterium]
MIKSKKRKLNERGNMLVFACCVVALIAMLALVGYSFSGLYFEHNRLQASADEIALTGAKKLNDRNRIGQLNNMISRCRQLVYSDRDDSKDVQANFKEIQKLSDQLMEESRQSAKDLENERTKIRSLAESEAVQAMHDKFNSIKQSYAMNLPWLRVRTPRVIGVGLGSMGSVESNVQEFDQFDKLKDSDRGQGYVAQYAKLNLYKSNQNEQLKDDNDLPFYLTSLSVPLQSEVSPPRVVSPDDYHEADDDPIPTATQVILDLRVENGIGFGSAGTMTAASTAITTGASDQD